MRTPCCHACLAFILKFLIFLQAFVGVAIVVYSAYMLNQWQHHHHQTYPRGILTVSPLNFASGVLSFRDDALRFKFGSLPAPWFIYAVMGVGILICCIAFIGHIGAEAINGCFLCCYSATATVFILLEVGLVTFLALDRQWEKDIPFDPTGQLDSLRTFIRDNVDVFEWVGVAIIATQVLSVLFAIILRSLVSRPRADDDEEEDYSFGTGTRDQLLSPYSGQASGSTRGDSDIWSSRMRMKYGLSSGDGKQISRNQTTSADVKP